MLKSLILAVGFIGANPTMPLDSFPYLTKEDATKELVGGGGGVCKAEDEESGTQVGIFEFEHPGFHITIWTFNKKWVGARYVPENNGPDVVWYGVSEGSNLRVRDTHKYRESENPCDWLLQ